MRLFEKNIETRKFFFSSYPHFFYDLVFHFQLTRQYYEPGNIKIPRLSIAKKVFNYNTYIGC